MYVLQNKTTNSTAHCQLCLHVAVQLFMQHFVSCAHLITWMDILNKTSSLPHITYLVGIKVYDHDTFHWGVMVENEVDGEGNICICTESTTLISPAMVEATTNIDGPTTFHCQLSCQHTPASLIPLFEEVWNGESRLYRLSISPALSHTSRVPGIVPLSTPSKFQLDPTTCR